MKGKLLLRTLIGALVIAVIVHGAVVFMLPRIIMNIAMAKFGTNKLSHGNPATAESRLIVRPSPDLCISRLAYDLSKGAMKLKVEVPKDNYWSVSFYADNTDNFFVINDRQVKSNPLEILLVSSDMKHSNHGNAQVVVSPSQRGIMLIRQLVPGPDKLKEVKEIQLRGQFFSRTDPS